MSLCQVHLLTTKLSPDGPRYPQCLRSYFGGVFVGKGKIECLYGKFVWRICLYSVTELLSQVLKKAETRRVQRGLDVP